MPVQATDGGLVVPPRPSLDGLRVESAVGDGASSFASAATTAVNGGAPMSITTGVGVPPPTTSWIPTHPYARAGLANNILTTSSIPTNTTNINSNSGPALGTGNGTASATSASHTLATRPSAATLVNDVDRDGTLGSVSMGISFPELDGRDPADQLETLRDMLEKETRLREGALNFLKMDLDVTVRTRVENELSQAGKKMDAIGKAMDTINQRRKKKPNGARPRQQSPAINASVGRASRRTETRPKDDGSEDHRAAKQQVNALLKTMLAYSRNVVSPTSISSASSSAGPPPPTSESELEKARIETMIVLAGVLQRNPRVRIEINTEELVAAVGSALADKASTRSRAIAYKLLRHSLFDRDSVERLLDQSIDWYMVKSLTRDIKLAREREQVIKLVRAFVELSGDRHASFTPPGCGNVLVTEPIMRAVIAIAEQPEDPLRQICCETLIETMLIDMDLMTRCGGTKVLFTALAEGPIELVPPIAMAFLYIIDTPRTRAYLHPGTDFEAALSGITDAYGKGASHTELMRSTAKVVCTILRTWSGLIYLCADDMLAIRSMIDTLRIPSLETREVVLDMFFELLNIDMPEWYQTFIDGRRLTMYRRHRPESHLFGRKESHGQPKAPDKLKLTDQYISLLIAILTKAGLLDALFAMLEESALGSNLSRKATLLVAEILQIANKVLPLDYSAKLQALPKVFALSSDYTHVEHRVVGTNALAAIDSFNRNRSRLQPAAPLKDSRQRANSVEDHVRRGQRQVEQVRIKLAMQMDDKTFQSCMVDTQVMLTRDHHKWKYDVLLELIEGPLLNPKRLEEAIKASTRFLKRLLAFFHPESRRFSDIPKKPDNLKWIKLGCLLLTTLMANSDGVRYLEVEDELLPQIVKGLRQLDPIFGPNAAPDFDPIFSKKRVEETLTSGYLEFLGVLSKHKDGIKLLEKHKIFTALYRMSELRSREDLMTGIIENIDYSDDGHPRIVLSKALTSSYKHVRIFATRHLGTLIRASPTASAWMLRLLLTQLYDPDRGVCELAVQYLEEACETLDVLKIVVDMQPTLEHLGEVANALLYKFMSTPVGFRYLYEVGFIEREMDTWLHERNFVFVTDVEMYLSRELNITLVDGDVQDDISIFDGIVPTHFYGELAKTEPGCQVLREKGHFAEFAHFLRQHALESEDFEIVFKLKSVIWAVGYVASAGGGLTFLEEEEILPVILEIAENSPVLSVRGTCFFAIGLISSTPQGAELLDDFGWEATLSPLGDPSGMCIPVDIDKFVAIDPWEQPEIEKRVDIMPPTNQEEVDVITTIGNLSNTVIANQASRSLAKMKAKPEFRSVFSSPAVFYRVLNMISTRRFRLPVRRYILELFDISLDPSIVKAISGCGKLLTEAAGAVTSPSHIKPRIQPRVSVFGRPVRGRNGSDSESDQDGVDEMEEEMPGKTKKEMERPVSLMPVRRVQGFQGVDKDVDASVNGRPRQESRANGLNLNRGKR